MRILLAAFLTQVTLMSTASGYEPEEAARQLISEKVKAELVEATPRAQRFSVRVAMTGNIAFNDYERLARSNGYEPYEDCTVATFVEVTTWQIIEGVEVDAPIIAALAERCRQADETVLGPKPLSQETGDREILRGMWQRNLDFLGRRLNDDTLLAVVRADAAARFRRLHGDPDELQLSDTGFSGKAIRREASVQNRGTVAADLAAGSVEQLVLRTVTRYGLSGVYVENATYLLLSDGSIYRKPFLNPYTLDVANSKRTQADDWGRWRKRGAALEVTWPGDDPDVWNRWFTIRPATAGQRLHGRYQSADGFGGGKVANFNTVSFNRDGRFSWAALKGGNTDWLPVYSDKERAGRYEFDRYSIRLRYNDGKVEEHAFGFYPKDDEHFVIGSSHFVPL